MLNSGKIFALCATKKNILTLVLSEKNVLNETKNHNPTPPFKLNGRSLNGYEMTSRSCKVYTCKVCNDDQS